MISALSLLLLGQVTTWGGVGQCLRYTSTGSGLTATWGECGVNDGGYYVSDAGNGWTSGLNTGDQTKTCTAGDFITVLATGTSSTCATPTALPGAPNYWYDAGVYVNSTFGVDGGLTLTGSMTATGTIGASNISGTNTGDQTKTCGANTFLTQLASGTSSTCTAETYVGTVTNVSGTAPIVSSGGATPAISITNACASTAGALTNSGGRLVIDAGFYVMGVDPSVFGGTLAASNLSNTNTGDQTKTCGAGTAVTTLATGTSSTCTAFGVGDMVKDAGYYFSGGYYTATGGTQSDAVIANYTAITGLAFTPEANTNYQMDCWVVYTSTAATTGINFAWDVPTSATINMDGHTKTVATGASEGFSQNTDNVGTATSAAVITAENLAVLSAILRNGANATSTTLGFTPETANSVSVIGAKSTCRIQKYP